MINVEKNEQAQEAALAAINTINAVEGFDPAALVVEYTNMNDGSRRYRLPVMAQIAWFRLRYPEGRIVQKVTPVKDYFIAEARVYASYKDPLDFYLAEGSASRMFIPDKPSVSPREWAQTAAIGIALRNAGFGLQFAVAGESFEDNTLNEFPFPGEQPTPDNGNTTAASVNNTPAPAAAPSQGSSPDANESGEAVQTENKQSEQTPLEKALAALCPIVKYKDKTLGEVLRIDQTAVAYVARNGGKYGEEIANYAKIICEHAVQQASA